MIYADPPWRYQNWKGQGVAERHYPTMTLEDIKALPVTGLAGKDCVLFLWATCPMLPEALDVIRAWGFTFKTVAFTWIKLAPKADSIYWGLGYWTRSNAEICLLATRGQPRRQAKNVHQVIISHVDEYRQEANAILKRRAAESNNLVQEKYITLSIPQRKIEETRSYFRRVDGNLTKSLGRLDSTAREVANHDRLRILHDFFRPGEEQYFTFDQTAAIRHGVDFKDLVCPDGISFKAGHFEMGGKYGRVLFLKEYASYIEDDMISDLSDFDRSLMLSIDILPIPTDEAVKEIQSRILGIESDITRWQQRQNDRNNFTAAIPYELEQLRSETKEFLSDLTERDQRMIFAVVTLVHIADTLEQLDADTETLLSIGREHLCQFSTLRYQQEDGLNTVLPYGLRRVKALRTLTTESAAVLMPYRVQEIQDPGGLSYGINAISRNLLICDRKRLISPHGFYLGVA